MKLLSTFIVSAVFFFSADAQNVPVFGNEIPVTITGLTFDAMEPFISPDGNYLFFNSLNDGITTSLYYAVRVNDSVFTYMGALNGADQTVTPRLDAVASCDSVNNFYWTSTRNWPAQYDNFFHGTFNGSDVVNTGRVHGNFYIYTPGWIVMDAAISTDGSLLWYCNAYFNNCSNMPCKAQLGVAAKLNDSTFAKLANSDGLLMNVNDTNYDVYAPNISSDGLELYFTRILKNNPTQTTICVSVRNTLNDTFGLPVVVYGSPLLPEAATLTTDMSRMYYHKKPGSQYQIFLRYRTSPSGIEATDNANPFFIAPNPCHDVLRIFSADGTAPGRVVIYDVAGQIVRTEADKTTLVDISALQAGVYFVSVMTAEKPAVIRIIKTYSGE
ncbi:MAG TPA: T9SS type A sorting domain-containing protein [Bacteroidia bacterium]|nr:T9SS type A sorting domain-containing protein [Bacteroidia bacterium]